MRILIADGDEVFLELARCYLLQHGHDTKAASDGLECAKLLSDFVPDVVVLDGGLLWGGCEGVVALMREHPGLSQTPMILIADDDRHNQFNNAVNPMLAGWLSKPFRLCELLKRIETAGRSARLAKRRRRSPLLAARAEEQQ